MAAMLCSAVFKQKTPLLQLGRMWYSSSSVPTTKLFIDGKFATNEVKELARLITLEQGKTLADAEGDVFRGLQVVEHACSITSLMLGETLPSITKDMDTYTYRLPLGVCAGIAPFNFPAMIPLWMFPIGMACGNTYLMKPSERVPGCTMLLAKLLQDAGAPDGTLNIIHGQHDAVNFICDNPAIKAISFVGSNQAGEYIYQRGSQNGKRVQSNMGAKNHGVVMPDANKENTLNQLVGAAFGAAGQRCMALSTAILVGEARDWLPELPGADVGPLISPEAKARSGVDEGAALLLDGRNVQVKGYENGNFVGPTIISKVTPEMDMLQGGRSSGPVLGGAGGGEPVTGRHQRLSQRGGTRTATGGTAIVHRQRRPPLHARWAVNVPIPGIQFYTQIKTVISQWKAEDATVTSPAVSMPTIR
ncbi:hypothetical protein CRUP_003634 [Coryphaenoides rupestris]|nr:hypothetical protein CRUP_003634 [Coryphaenoides rupestris]